MTIPKGYRRIERSGWEPSRYARFIGEADPEETLSVTVCVRRRPEAPPLPVQETWAATPIAQRRYIAREKFAVLYGAAPEDIERVIDFARNHDLTVTEWSAAKRTVLVSGTVSQMNRAFAVKLGHYKTPAETFRSHEAPVHLPVHVADVVEGVLGLDNRQMARRASNGGGSTFMKPPKVAQLYNFPTSTNGSGQTIGIIEFGGGYLREDIDAFFEGLGLSTPALTDVSVDGQTNSPTDPLTDLEITGDVDVAGSVANGAKIVVYFAPNTIQGWLDAFSTAIYDSINKPSVLSISYAWNEEYASSSGFIDLLSPKLQEAAYLGVTVLASSGDAGSRAGIAIAYPASDPWVTACGGTSITNVSGSSFTESTWPNSGGGISTHFPLPSWQLGAGICPAANDQHSGRGLPDVAGNAASSYGIYLGVVGSDCGFWGTSAVNPLYAGLVALLNAGLGNPVGYLNPHLYRFATLPGLNVFRDIADGVSTGQYTSGPGWDACTGWGSINGSALLEALQSRPVCPVGALMLLTGI